MFEIFIQVGYQSWNPKILITYLIGTSLQSLLSRGLGGDLLKHIACKLYVPSLEHIHNCITLFLKISHRKKKKKKN